MRSLVLVVAVGCAGGKPTTDPKPVAPDLACPGAAPVLYQLDFKHENPAGYAFRTIAIQDNGAWSYVETTDGKSHRSGSGCLDAATIGALRRALAPAPWKIARAQVVCEAYSDEFVEYRVAGKLVFTRRVCGIDVLDAASARATQDADAIAFKLMPPSPN